MNKGQIIKQGKKQTSWKQRVLLKMGLKSWPTSSNFQIFDLFSDPSPILTLQLRCLLRSQLNTKIEQAFNNNSWETLEKILWKEVMSAGHCCKLSIDFRHPCKKKTQKLSPFLSFQVFPKAGGVGCTVGEGLQPIHFPNWQLTGMQCNTAWNMGRNRSIKRDSEWAVEIMNLNFSVASVFVL